MSGAYSRIGPFYDLLSGEYPVYRAGRELGIAALQLTEGAQVLDIGCGTGLNFPLLQRAIGPRGLIVGVDRSAGMLDQARRRALRQGWRNVLLLEADATAVDVAEVGRDIEKHGGRAESDAAIATYSLSLMSPWRDAWDRMVQLTSPGGTLAVVDMRDPVGRWTAMTPLARLACRLGGADIDAHPWRAVEDVCSDVTALSARGGHLQVRTGRRRARPVHHPAH